MGGHTLWSSSRQHYIWLACLFYTQHIVCQRKSKKILSRRSICLHQKLLNFMLPLLIYGLISTKEKSWEKLTAFLPAFFIKKKASAQRTQRPTRKETYTPPLRSGTKPSHNVKAVIAPSCVLQLKFNIKTFKEANQDSYFFAFFLTAR